MAAASSLLKRFLHWRWFDGDLSLGGPTISKFVAECTRELVSDENVSEDSAVAVVVFASSVLVGSILVSDDVDNDDDVDLEERVGLVLISTTRG